METEHIVFLDAASLPVSLRAPGFPHTWTAHATTPPEEASHRLREATIAITNKVPITAALLAACPRLRLVAVAATGCDVVDLAACQARGVAVTNVRDYARGAVAEHVFLLMLALQRDLTGYRAAVAAGTWSQSPVFCVHAGAISDLEGATLGLIGHGALARSVQVRAEAFGMQVLVAERRGAASIREGRVPFDQVLGEADVLSLHCPLTPETRHLLDAENLARMKKGAVLINTARGALVDSQALLAALEAGHLGGAGIDVMDAEPPPPDAALLASRHPRLIVTPHVAWASQASMARLAEQLIAVMEAWRAGGTLNRLV